MFPLKFGKYLKQHGDPLFIQGEKVLLETYFAGRYRISVINDMDANSARYGGKDPRAIGSLRESGSGLRLISERGLNIPRGPEQIPDLPDRPVKVHKAYFPGVIDTTETGAGAQPASKTDLAHS